MKFPSNIFPNKSGMGVCFRSTKWWSFKDRTLVIVLVLCKLLPTAHSDEPHSSQTGGETKYRHALINISFMDPVTNKERTLSFDGKFGVQSLVSAISGPVFQVMSETKDRNGKSTKNRFGCTKYVNSILPSDNWIALVERGDCNFSTKVQVATKANATAIVVYNNQTAGSDTVMEHTASSIVAVLITRNDGFQMVEYLDKGITVTMHIGVGKEGILSPLSQNSISKTSVLFVSISFIVLMIISLAWLGFYYIQRFRYSHAKERLARRLACAAKKAIAKIPQKTIKSGDKELENDFDQCAVCIEPYKAHDVIRSLPCRHVFHKSCVDPWLLDQRSCPMCKLDILRAYGMQVGGSQESVRPDPESAHVPARIIHHDEPEPSSSTGESHHEEIKVLVAHFHLGREKQGTLDEASSSLLGHAGVESVPRSNSSASLHSKSSASISRAKRSDETVGGSSEMTALLKMDADGVRRNWNSDEEEDGDKSDLSSVAASNQAGGDDEGRGKKNKKKVKGDRQDSVSSPSDRWDESSVSYKSSGHHDPDGSSTCSCVTADSDEDESQSSYVKLKFHSGPDDQRENSA